MFRFVTFTLGCSPDPMKTLFLLLALSPFLLAQNLTFDDEFNGIELDLSKWIPHDPRVTFFPLETATVSGGQLHLSGTISTFGLFAQMYGRFEIRFRASAGAKFALASVPDGTLPRIDVFRAAAPDRIFLGNWWGSEQTERSYGDSFTVPDLSKVFHTIVLEWERDRVTWSLDGKKTFESVDGIPQRPMFLLIAAPLDIAYVRVYQRKGQ